MILVTGATGNNGLGIVKLKELRACFGRLRGIKLEPRSQVSQKTHLVRLFNINEKQRTGMKPE